MAITLRDIADRCQVSRAAVSQVLRNPEHTSFPPATRKRILDTARELNYLPNRLAIGLRRGQTHLLSLIFPYNDPQLIDSAQKAADELGYGLMIQFTPEPNVVAEARALRAAMERQVDGIIWQPAASEDHYCTIISQLQQSNTSIVLLENRLPGLTKADVIQTNFDEGTSLAIQHLIERGCRKIVFVAETPVDKLFNQRIKGFTQISQQHPIAAHVLIAETGSLNCDRVMQMLEGADDPVGFYCNSEWLAFDLLEIFESRNIQIPSQAGIIALGERVIGGRHHIGLLSRPRLSVVRPGSLPKTELAIKRLALRIEKGNTLPSQNTLIPMELIQRQST